MQYYWWKFIANTVDYRGKNSICSMASILKKDERDDKMRKGKVRHVVTEKPHSLYCQCYYDFSLSRFQNQEDVNWYFQVNQEKPTLIEIRWFN